MTLLTWNHATTTGIRAMDDQHGVLMDTMNELRLAVVHGDPWEQVNDLLDRLIAFARMHFGSEEQLMEQHGFPGFASHRAEHRRLLKTLIDSAHKLQRDDIRMRPLLCSLQSYFVDHIAEFDRQYGPWLNERGIH